MKKILKKEKSLPKNGIYLITTTNLNQQDTILRNSLSKIIYLKINEDYIKTNNIKIVIM